jgi:glutathione S-transferase
MKLIGSLTSPFVRKVRIALIERQIEHAFQIESAWNQTDIISTLNPLRKTPVLILADGLVIVDSSVIIEYLDSIGSAPRLLPDEFSQRITLRSLEALADGMAEAVIAQVQETWRAPMAQSAAWIDRQKQKVTQTMFCMEQHLRLGKWPTLNPNSQLTAFDIALYCALCVHEYWSDDTPHWRAQHPKLASWYLQMTTRESIQQTAPPAIKPSSFPKF